MLIYAGKDFTASVAGRRIDTVVCEKCSTTFHYQLTRSGVGRASSPYYLFQSAAKKRAQSAAEKDLAKRLENEAELVPCPKCSWVNFDLIQRYRLRKYRRPWGVLALLMFGGVVIGPMLAAAMPSPHKHGSLSNLQMIVMFTVMGIGLLSPVWLSLILAQLRNRIDPNVSYPRRPALPPGTPPALVDSTDPKTGEACLVPARSAAQDLQDADGWLVFRPGDVTLAPVCCCCMEPATTTYKSPFRMNDRDSDVAMPLCRACSWKLWRKWWMVAFMITVIALGIPALLAAMAKSGDPFGRWMLAAIAGVFFSLFGAAIVPNKLCRPYRVKVVDADRGVMKFKAQNAQYTELLAERSRAA
jgi:hypothetical protein